MILKVNRGVLIKESMLNVSTVYIGADDVYVVHPEKGDGYQVFNKVTDSYIGDIDKDEFKKWFDTVENLYKG